MENSGKNSTRIKGEYKNLAKNSLYSLLNQYSSIFYSILASLIIARLISPETWGLLILSTSYVMTVAIFTFFLPPALEYSMIYYIPKYIISNQNTKLKSFLKRGLIIKALVLIFIFILSIFIFRVIVEIINFGQKDKFNLILSILSPLVFVFGSRPILNSINQGFNNFKIIFLLFVLKAVLNISALIFVFFVIREVQVELIAAINVITELIPFILNCLIIFRLYSKIDDTNEEGLTYREFIQMTIKYGGPISFNYLEYTLWNEIQIQGIGILNQPNYITGYNISLSYSNVAKNASTSLHTPLTTTFNRLDLSKTDDTIVSFYNLVIKYSLFILLFFAGLLFFVADFYLVIIYGDLYLEYSIFLKIMVLSIIFRVLITPFDSLLYAQNRTKLLPRIRLIMLVIQIPLFFIGVINFGIIGAVVAIFIINLLLFFFFIILNFKILKIRIILKTILLQYLTLIISISVTLLIKFYLYDYLTSIFIELLNLTFLKYFPLFSIVTFLLLYFMFNIIFKIFSSKDLEIVDSFLNKDSKVIRYFRRRFKFLKKLIKTFE